MPANRQFPVLSWIFDYQKGRLQCDLIAGLITTAVVIPKAMASAACRLRRRLRRAIYRLRSGKSGRTQ